MSSIWDCAQIMFWYNWHLNFKVVNSVMLNYDRAAHMEEGGKFFPTKSYSTTDYNNYCDYKESSSILSQTDYFCGVYYDERDAHLMAWKVLRNIFLSFFFIHSRYTYHICLDFSFLSYVFGFFLSVICVRTFPFSLSLSSSYVLYPMGFVPIIPWMFPRYAWSTIIYSRLLFINKDIESCVTRSLFHT